MLLPSELQDAYLQTEIMYNTCANSWYTRTPNWNMLGHNVILILSKKKLLAHMHLLSSQAQDSKSRALNEAEQALARESAEAAKETTKMKEAMTSNTEPIAKKQKLKSGSCRSPTALRSDN